MRSGCRSVRATLAGCVVVACSLAAASQRAAADPVDDARQEVVEAKRSLADAQRIVLDLKRTLDAQSDALADIRADLTRQQKDLAVVVPLLKRAAADVEVTLRQSRSLAAERKAARDAATTAVTLAEQEAKSAAAELARQTQEEQTLIESNPEYKALQARVDAESKRADAARNAVLARLDALPEQQQRRAAIDKLDLDVRRLREAGPDGSAELLEASRKWIELKGQYETARQAEVEKDPSWQQANEALEVARAEAQALRAKLTGGVAEAPDVAAAKIELDRAKESLTEARKRAVLATAGLKDAEAIVVERERSAREFRILPEKLDDRLAATVERVKQGEARLVDVLRSLELARQRVAAAAESVANAEKELKDAQARPQTPGRR